MNVVPKVKRTLEKKNLASLTSYPPLDPTQSEIASNIKSQGTIQASFFDSDGRLSRFLGSVKNSHGKPPTGANSTIVVVDKCIDPGDRQFKDNQDRTRVLAYVYFDPDSNSWKSIDSIDIAQQKYPSNFSRYKGGHGTLITKIAADKQYGLAPGANLILVDLQQPVDSGISPRVDPFQTIHEALDTVISVIKKHPMPFVVNFSLCRPDGPRDGISDIKDYDIQSRLLSSPLCRGIVVSAGNDNYSREFLDFAGTAGIKQLFRSDYVHDAKGRRNHIRGKGSARIELEMETSTSKVDSNYDGCTVSIWLPPGPQGSVTVTYPDSKTVHSTKFNGNSAVFNNEDGFNIMIEPWTFGGDEAGASIDTYYVHCRIYWDECFDNTAPLQNGRYTIDLELQPGSSGDWDAYVTEKKPFQLIKAFSECSLGLSHNSYKVNTMGCSSQVIMVGAINDAFPKGTANKPFASIPDKSYSVDGIGHYSSRGPSRSGVDKPDVYSYGGPIILWGKNNSQLVDGTSLAAPIVSATIALMIELDTDGSLTAKSVKDILLKYANATSCESFCNRTGCDSDSAYSPGHEKNPHFETIRAIDRKSLEEILRASIAQ